MTVAPVPGNGPSQARRTALFVIKLQLNCHDKGRRESPRSGRARGRLSRYFCSLLREHNTRPNCGSTAEKRNEVPPPQEPPKSKTTNLLIEKNCCAWQQNQRAHVRFGSKADIQSKKHDVRFTPESGHWLSASGCPLCANSGHRFGLAHSITPSAMTNYFLWNLMPSVLAVSSSKRVACTRV